MQDLLRHNPEVLDDTSRLKQKIQELERTIAELKETNEKLRESEREHRLILEYMSDTVWTLDINMNPTYVGKSSEKILGFTPEERLNQSLSDMVTPETYTRLMEMLAQELQKEGEGNADPRRTITIEMEYYHKDGHTRWLENRVQAIRDDEGKITGLHGVSRDVTERKIMEEALKESEKKYHALSIIDNLTDLYNLRQFYTQLKIETDRSNRYNHPLTLLFLDLDNFKRFNDAYGHVEGDKVLQRVSQIIKGCLRETDFAYRYGGEEFTVILPMTTGAEGAIIAKRILSEIKNETFSPLPGENVHVTLSIGLAQYKPQEDMKSFVHRADHFMYRGKKSGKDQVCHDEPSKK